MMRFFIILIPLIDYFLGALLVKVVHFFLKKDGETFGYFK